jgi:hypothetical protein
LQISIVVHKYYRNLRSNRSSNSKIRTGNFVQTICSARTCDWSLTRDVRRHPLFSNCKQFFFQNWNRFEI